jgi:DUF4097 and DUF4098 domain-containing protein YvlB
MSNTVKVVLVVTSVILVCLISAGILLSVYFAGVGEGTNIFDIFSVSHISVDETHELDLSGISSVSVECASADIEFVPDSEPRVEMTGNLWTPEEKEEYLNVTEEDGKLAVKLDLIRSLFVDVDITVYLPEDSGLNLNVSCASGDTTIQQLKLGDISISCASGNTDISSCTGGAIEIGTASGNANIGNCAFDSIRTVCQSGSIQIRDTQSAVTIDCTSGKVIITDVTGALDIGSISGNVVISLSQKEIDPIDIDVTSGSITLNLNAQAAFNLDVDTTSGGIQCDFDRTVSGGSSDSFVGDHISGECNGGGVSVTLSTVSGGIDIRKQ